VCSPLPLGRGHVDCAHGRIPVPAPATLALLEGVPVLGGDIDGETVTPTGAAAAVVLADAFGPLPPGRLLGTGIGAGKAERDAPNLLRALLLEADGTSTEVVQIETNVDDMPAEAFAPLMDRLFEAGALDVALCPVQMKKNRPGVLVTVIADPERSAGITEALLLHSTTFGVRESRMRRTCLERDEVRVETPWGPVRAKRGRLSGRTVRVVPEHDDCRRLAGEKGVPYMDVYRAALAAGDQSKSTSSG